MKRKLTQLSNTFDSFFADAPTVVIEPKRRRPSLPVSDQSSQRQPIITVNSEGPRYANVATNAFRVTEKWNGRPECGGGFPIWKQLHH